MTKSFYHYLLKYRNKESNEGYAQFAESAFYDSSFPTQEKDYYKLCEYLELNGQYLSSMVIFDELYEMYKENV